VRTEHTVNGDGRSHRQRNRLLFTIRSASVDDATALAALCVQADHLAQPEEVAERLQLIVHHGAGMVLVAVAEEARVVGLLHIAPHYSLGSPPQAAILGLVVDQRSRGARIGTALLGAAEMWARERRLRLMQVHSELVREEADRFYHGRGYRRLREQQLFRKELA
jgi:GNAT superfamily N-acetyltransferase